MADEKYVRVTEEESVKLLHHAAGTGEMVHFHFGPGWLALPWDGQTLTPAMRELCRLRGWTTENCDGAGI